MIDHLGTPVGDYARSLAFYRALLDSIGAELVMEADPALTSAGFGRHGKPDFRISEGRVGDPVHVAFRGGSRAAVDAFHRAGLALGARDHGAPGLRPHYHPSYYGAFLLDPDGHNIEAVCHGEDA